jgi:predicted metal-dependent phosphoesterase TrpH
MDLHIHSTYSADSTITPRQVLNIARKRHLSGVAITDHNSIRGCIKVKALKVKGLLFVPGIEVTSEQGHVLALGITEKVPRGLSVQETIERIEDIGGLAVAAHPYRFYTGIGELATRGSGFRAVEIFNGRTTLKGNMKAKALAKELDVGITGGSDGHRIEEIGSAFTKVPAEIDTVDDLITAIVKKRTRIGGTPAGLGSIVSNSASNVYHWLGRGMRRM